MANDSTFATVPHLTTALSGPLKSLESKIIEQQVTIETWLRKKWQQFPPPATSSVDLRNAGFKLAPVDTNLFPAGFNNLNADFMPLCIQAAESFITATFPNCEKILLISENHNRNLRYFESLSVLHTILQKAGFEVYIGSFAESLTTAQDIELANHANITIHPIEQVGNHITVNGQTPCLILLNNDLSGGIPDILVDIEQKIHPPPSLGWAKRLKSNHFRYYSEICKEFAELINIDPWLIEPEFRNCGQINFMKKEGGNCIEKQTQQLLQSTAENYRKHQVDKQPYVVIKADAGTYGMGIMTVKDPQEVTTMNRKQRTKMSTSKEKNPVSQVIIQEGVYTFETWGDDNAAAEPVVYMIGQHVVGGFYRVHKGKTSHDNLNAPGMQFEPLAFAASCNNPDFASAQPDTSANRFYAYGVIARLALLAAAMELQETCQ